MLFNFFKNKFAKKTKSSKNRQINLGGTPINDVKKELSEDIFRENILSIAYLLYESGNKEKINNSSSRLNEFIDRLLIRYLEIKEIELEMHTVEEVKNPRPMVEIQTDFVNKTEGFHQQFYAVIGAYIKLLSHSTSSKFIRNMPYSKTSDFLKYIKKMIPDVEQAVERVLKSTNEYRSVFVDHTNQNSNHNWYTMCGLDGKAYIIYYVIGEGERKLLHIPELSFGSMKVYTPFKATSYFIPPNYKETMKAFIHLVSKTLLFLKEEKEEVDSSHV